MNSEALRNLLQEDLVHDSVDELLALRVVQTSLRFACLGCNWVALIT